MSATKPSVRVTVALLALLAAAPALAQHREPPPEPWPEAARPDDDDDRPAPPAARGDRDDDREAARPAPPPNPYYPVRPARPRSRPAPAARAPAYAPGYAPGYGPGYGPAYAPREAYYWPRVEVALRGGVASPGGSAVDGVPMRDLFGNQLTLGVDLGLRATPHVYVGLFAEGGLGLGGDRVATCSGSTGDCGAASGRIGAALHYHFAPAAPLDPWIGYGVAISGATVSGSDALGTFDRTFSGVEYAKLMAGVDMRLAGTATLGLYAEWTSGVFTQVEAKENGVVVDSGGVGTTTTHSWFTMGPRLKF